MDDIETHAKTGKDKEDINDLFRKREAYVEDPGKEEEEMAKLLELDVVTTERTKDFDQRENLMAIVADL